MKHTRAIAAFILTTLTFPFVAPDLQANDDTEVFKAGDTFSNSTFPVDFEFVARIQQCMARLGFDTTPRACGKIVEVTYSNGRTGHHTCLDVLMSNDLPGDFTEECERCLTYADAQRQCYANDKKSTSAATQDAAATKGFYVRDLLASKFDKLEFSEDLSSSTLYLKDGSQIKDEEKISELLTLEAGQDVRIDGIKSSVKEIAAARAEVRDIKEGSDALAGEGYCAMLGVFGSGVAGAGLGFLCVPAAPGIFLGCLVVGGSYGVGYAIGSCITSSDPADHPLPPNYQPLPKPPEEPKGHCSCNTGCGSMVFGFTTWIDIHGDSEKECTLNNAEYYKIGSNLCSENRDRYMRFFGPCNWVPSPAN